MGERMKIIIDAMGGDNAPAEIVKGAVEAQKEFGVDITLIGIEEKVRECLAQFGGEVNEHISVVNATEVIDMHDEPSMACRRKKDSSMTVGLNMLHAGEGDAMVSAGSTGDIVLENVIASEKISVVRTTGDVLLNGCDGAELLLKSSTGDIEGTLLTEKALI